MKVDQLQIELSHFDVVALSETWLSQFVRDEEISFPNFQKPYCKNRQDHYGGVIVDVKIAFLAKDDTTWRLLELNAYGLN